VGSQVPQIPKQQWRVQTIAAGEVSEDPSTVTLVLSLYPVEQEQILLPGEAVLVERERVLVNWDCIRVESVGGKCSYAEL
jgi:hypothetical protein